MIRRFGFQRGVWGSDQCWAGRRRAGLDPVVPPVCDPERDPLDPLDQVVDRYLELVGWNAASTGV